MKRTAAILLALVMALSLIACTGSSDPKSSDPNLGLYEATTMEYMGFSVGVSDLFEQGFSIELKANGKCVLNADGKTANGKWTLDGRDFTVKGGGLDCTGTLENGVILLQYDDDVTITLVNGSYRAPTAVPTAQTEKQTEPAKTDPIEPNQQTKAGQQGAQTVSESNEFWITEYEANGMKYEGDALKTTGLDQTYLRLNDDHTGYLMMMGDGFEIGWDEKNLTIAGVPMYSYEYLDADTIRLSMYETILFTLKRKTGESPAQQGAPAATEAPKTTEAPAAEAAGNGAPYGSSDGVISRAKLAGLYRWLRSMDSDFRHLERRRSRDYDRDVQKQGYRLVGQLDRGFRRAEQRIQHGGSFRLPGLRQRRAGRLEPRCVGYAEGKGRVLRSGGRGHGKGADRELDGDRALPRGAVCKHAEPGQRRVRFVVSFGRVLRVARKDQFLSGFVHKSDRTGRPHDRRHPDGRPELLQHRHGLDRILRRAFRRRLGQRETDRRRLYGGHRNRGDRKQSFLLIGEMS